MSRKRLAERERQARGGTDKDKETERHGDKDRAPEKA